MTDTKRTTFPFDDDRMIARTFLRQHSTTLISMAGFGCLKLDTWPPALTLSSHGVIAHYMFDGSIEARAPIPNDHDRLRIHQMLNHLMVELGGKPRLTLERVPAGAFTLTAMLDGQPMTRTTFVLAGPLTVHAWRAANPLPSPTPGDTP